MLGRRVPQGGVFEGLQYAGSGPKQVLRAPRLSQELLSTQTLELGIDDFRKLEPSVVIEKLQQSEKEPEKRAMLAAAIFVGTAQACLKGSFWAPHFGADSAERQEESCEHLVRPISCVHGKDKMPPPQAAQPKASASEFSITALKGANELDAALQLSSSPGHHHVCVIRCSAIENPRAERKRYGNIFEDQLFLRTTYAEAFERLPYEADLHPNNAIAQGDVIYSSGVGLLRGPVQEGAPWVSRPPQIDVAWIGLPARPAVAEQELLALESDRDLVRDRLDRAFAWAAHHGADAVALPPLGCGTHGCGMPRLQMAGLIHEVAQKYKEQIRAVCVASDHPGMCEDSWWDDFAKGVETGRPTPDPLVHVPPIPLPNYLLIKKEPFQLLEKRRKQLGAWTGPRGTGRPTFL